MDWAGLGKIGLRIQSAGDRKRAVENHMGLLLDGIRGPNEAGTLMERSAVGRGQRAFPFHAKVMATREGTLA